MKEYNKLLQDSEEFQDYLTIELIKYGIILMNFSSWKYQLQGEGYTKYEIKLDNNMNKTGNLYIETAERKDRNSNWIKSGINRDDGSLHYLIGDYKKVYIFQKKILKTLCSDVLLQRVSTTTSQGILVSTEQAKHFSIVINLETGKVN